MSRAADLLISKVERVALVSIALLHLMLLLHQLAPRGACILKVRQARVAVLSSPALTPSPADGAPQAVAATARAPAHAATPSD